MAWYDESVFYHIYPLGLTGAPAQNDYGEVVHRLPKLLPWIDHIKEIGCNAIYIGPLFESVGHGYETTDYRTLDRRLGDNDDLKEFVRTCHEKGVRVIFDGVFNHTGRDFFAFKDLQKNRENSQYKDWYCNVNFGGNNEYNDGFSYDNWGGYNLLVKLNQWNPQVKDYIYDVTNYNLNKALWSGCNEHNFFEIAHTVKRLYDMGGCHYRNLELYSFADNHDVERIASKIINKDHLGVIYTLMYTLPGIPSIYYGSEFGIEGKKEQGSDASLRPHLELSDYADAMTDNPLTALIAKLGSIHQAQKALCYGEYKELLLTNRQYAFARCYENEDVITAVNNDEQSTTLHIPYQGPKTQFKGALSGKDYMVQNGSIEITLDACGGDILI